MNGPETARPAGYMIGGKTGTAETLPRGNDEFVVSFMGYAPADDPQIAIYVVVDRPNVMYQDDAKYATKIVKSILTEVLPYLNIFMTEELTDTERTELEELQIAIRQGETDNTDEEGVSGEEGGEGENPAEGNAEGEGGESSGKEGAEGGGEGQAGAAANEIWKTFPIDPETGYAKDPNTGNLVDPDTGAVVNGGSLITNEDGSAASGIGEPPKGDDSDNNNFGP